jgi:MFS family permease
MVAAARRVLTLHTSMRGQILLLASTQALFQTASALVVTVGALAGGQVAGTPGLATAPVAAMLFGTASMIIPASMWMARRGRRSGFVLGSILGVLGGLIAAWGVHSKSLPVMSLGTCLIGAYQGFAQFYRFAASEIATVDYRPRAIALVLAGGVVAAFLGPALGLFGSDLLETPYAGSFLLLSASCIVAALLLLNLVNPTVDVAEGENRPLRAIISQPNYFVALFGAATGSGVMVLAMTATPLAMAHHHHGLSASATVIQAHMLGMFVPSFFTGTLLARFGVVRIMVAGVMLMAAHVAMSVSGTGIFSFMSALVLLGVGWNFLFVGGTTMLTDAYLPGERAKAQATNDFVVYVVGLVSSLSAGVLLDLVGWERLNLLLLPWLACALLAVLWLRRRRRIQSLHRPQDVPPTTRGQQQVE